MSDVFEMPGKMGHNDHVVNEINYKCFILTVNESANFA